MTGPAPIELGLQPSLWGILATTERLYRRHPLLFALLALMVMAPYELAFALAGYPLLGTDKGHVGLSLLDSLLRTALITPLISALHMHAVAIISEGARPRLLAVTLRGLRVLPVVTAAAIMSTLGITLGLIALIVPGIVLTLRWAVVAQAASLEEGDWVAALHSSRSLTAKNYGRIIGLFLTIGLVGFAAHLGARAIHLGSPTSGGSVAAGIVIDTLVASFSALSFAVLYFDLRARSELPPSPPREYPHLRDLD